MSAKRRAQHKDRGSHHCLRPGSRNKPQKETTSVDWIPRECHGQNVLNRQIKQEAILQVIAFNWLC